MREDKERVTLSLTLLCSANVDNICCFTNCGGSTPSNDRPVQVCSVQVWACGHGGMGEWGNGGWKYTMFAS